jgi:hypothetical protein
MKNYFYLAMAIGLSFIPALASAAPSLPMSFWGTATVNSSTNVPVGTVVRSYSATGELYDSTIVTAARLIFEGSGTITFKAIIPGYAGGAEVTAAETETYTAGISEVKNLTFTATADNVCNPSVVSHGTVGAYPGCVLTCSSGYYKSGNSCLSSGGGSSGSGASDTTAPTISNIVATPTSGTTATITWNTNESSLTWLNYGTSTAYGSQVKTTSYASSHSASLAGLTASTTYHYQVKSQDSSGNVGTAGDKTFTTLAAGQTSSSTSSSSTTTGSTGGSTTSTNPNVSQMTREQLIAFILQLIAAMQTSGTTGTTTGGTTGTGTGSTTGLSAIPATFTFQTNLRFGMEMIDVKYLQIILNSSADTKVALTGVGSSGYETTRFGNATLAAVKNFQLKYGITTSAGYGLVGPATRVKLNGLLGR